MAPCLERSVGVLEDASQGLGEIGEGYLVEGAKVGKVGELIEEAKKAFRNLNPYSSDPDMYRRYTYPHVAKKKGSDIDSFFDRLRNGDREEKENKSHEGCSTINSGDDDEGEEMEEIVLGFQEFLALTRNDCWDENLETACNKDTPLAQQENTEVCQGDDDDDDDDDWRPDVPEKDDEWRPIVPQKDDNEWKPTVPPKDYKEWRPYVPEKDNQGREFEYYMSLKPAEPWSPIDEF